MSIRLEEVELDLVIKALTHMKNKPMCDIHASMIDGLTSQFEEVFTELTQKMLDFYGD